MKIIKKCRNTDIRNQDFFFRCACVKWFFVLDKNSYKQTWSGRLNVSLVWVWKVCCVRRVLGYLVFNVTKPGWKNKSAFITWLKRILNVCFLLFLLYSVWETLIIECLDLNCVLMDAKNNTLDDGCKGCV